MVSKVVYGKTVRFERKEAEAEFHKDKDFHKPMFSKRHYEEVAKVLNDFVLAHEYMTSHSDLHHLVSMFSQLFGEDNKKFDDRKFEDAVFSQTKLGG